MGNYILSPFQKNNDKNIHNINNENNKIEKRKSPLPNNTGIYSNLNDLTNFGDKSNNLNRNRIKSNTNIYYHGYKYKKNKKSKLLFADTKEGIIMNNIKRMSLIIFKDKTDKKENGDNTIDNDLNKKPNYMKGYNNNDKFYKYGMKEKEDKKMIKNMKQNKNKENKDNSKLKNKSNKNKSKRNKSKKKEKNEKSSQFILLNNYNDFNALKEINKEKNFSSNKDKIEKIDEREINNLEDDENKKIEKDNFENEINYLKDSPIKEKPNKEINEDDDLKNNQYICEEIPYIKNKEKESENEKNINFKETNDASENLFLESKLIESSVYSFRGEAPNNMKEGIGKFVYRNRIGLMSIYENNKIIGPIIISDTKGNSFQGYINENNNLDGYFNLKFNFNKDDIKKKYKYRNNILINESKDKVEMVALSNFMNILNTYLNLSNIKYNYFHIESIISNNNINNYGIIKWRNNSKYMGEIKNNMKHGIGIFIWPDYSRYEGQFFEDKMEGWGLIHFFDGKLFRGQILNGIPHGYGEFIWNNNNRYVGNYIKGQKEGFGIYIMNIINKNKSKNDIVTYFGFWKNGKQDGYGIVIKNKKINYVKYKEGKKVRQYDYDIFVGKISKVINKKHEKIFFSDLKTLKNIIKNIMKF